MQLPGFIQDSRKLSCGSHTSTQRMGHDTGSHSWLELAAGPQASDQSCACFFFCKRWRHIPPLIVSEDLQMESTECEVLRADTLYYNNKEAIDKAL